MSISFYPEKLNRSNTDWLLIEDGDDSAFKSMLVSTLLANLSGGGGGGLANWQILSANHTAIPGDRIIANTGTNSWILTLPPNPSLGDEIEIMPLASVASNNLFIEGLTKFETREVLRLKANKPYRTSKLVYVNSSIGWIQDSLLLEPVYPSTALTYVSNGDANGLFYYLGTNKGLEAWSNPLVANRIAVFYSSILGGQSPVESLVDRQPSFFHTNTTTPLFIEFDLLASNKLTVNYWTYRSRSNALDHIPNRLVLSVSNDRVNYTQIDDKSFTPAQNTYYSFPVLSQSVGYRYCKFTAFGTQYFTAGEFELYGSLVST